MPRHSSNPPAQRPSTAPLPRHSSNPPGRGQPPPAFGAESFDNAAASFPDPRDLPQTFQGGAQRPEPPSLKRETPSQGFDAFGAIDDLPSIHSTSGVTASLSPFDQPSPLGPDHPLPRAPHPSTMQSPHMVPPPPQPQPRRDPDPRSVAPPLPPPPTARISQRPPPQAPPHQPIGAQRAAPFGNYFGQPIQPSPFDVLPPAVGGYSMPPGAQAGTGAPILVDVTPRALVVETVGGYCDTVIPRNAKIPCERTRQFTTGSDFQTVVRVRVAQGEHAQFLHDTYLGEVELSGIRRARRGEVQIGVTFELDADGSLRVRATDMDTGQEAVATLQLVGLATDEPSIISMIDRMARQPINKDFS